VSLEPGVRATPGTVCIDCFELTGGQLLIIDLIERSLTYPRFRERLGTEWSLTHRPL
jgi:hypothetical protein